MQTKYYLSFEQVGIIRRIPLKEQDPDMQGILDAFIKAFRIANELGDEEEVTREVKPFKKKKPFLSEFINQSKGSQSNCLFLYVEPQLY